VEFEAPSDLECWIVDASPAGEYTFGGRKVTASVEGVLVLRWPRGKRILSRGPNSCCSTREQRRAMRY